MLLSIMLACGGGPTAAAPEPPDELPAPAPVQATVDPYAAERAAMVERDLAGRDIRDERVLDAMAAVPRERFVPDAMRGLAYRDHPLPIGEDQTISQPYIVAFMSQAAEIEAGERCLEVGTGSGYQAAVLVELGCEVYTIEIVPSLGKTAAAALKQAGYAVHARIGDGYQGWPEAAPFDAVLVTASPDHVPEPLIDQLALGGHLVIPVETDAGHQALVRLTRTEADAIEREELLPVAFVPMTGEAEAR